MSKSTFDLAQTLYNIKKTRDEDYHDILIFKYNSIIEVLEYRINRLYYYYPEMEEIPSLEIVVPRAIGSLLCLITDHNPQSEIIMINKTNRYRYHIIPRYTNQMVIY